MSNRLITKDEIAEWERTGTAAWIEEGSRRCPLMPSESHCWHDRGLWWDGLFPPPMVCCWCGQENATGEAVPYRHGPHAEE